VGVVVVVVVGVGVAWDVGVALAVEPCPPAAMTSGCRWEVVVDG